ncbi:MAG: thiolase family protein [Pseudomonadales bacterium]|nr:thiolase family protein [Pseudomonadales bacterium]MDP7356898.1 thiolase family protein [Pseudomonadales bacterium]MDP7596005.1 thiolase family protein [Pseudomonadales bacterium]HJN52781.1 thiolase family protein [Pseudomonadales bacterium]
MSMTLKQMRPVYVIGVGLDRYQRASERPYVEMGLTAIRAALADGNIEWQDVESFYLGTLALGMAPARTMIRHLGTTGVAIAQVENASASGSTSFRQACLDVASGITDVSMATGIDKLGPINSAAAQLGFDSLVRKPMAPVAQFALLANRYMSEYGTSLEQLASVAVKNHRNGAMNPYAQRQKVRTLEEVLAPPYISGPLSRLQCCPFGEGAAAVLVASEQAVSALPIDETRLVRVIASVSRSEQLYSAGENSDSELTGSSIKMAFEQAEISADQLDVVELHDAFSIEEILYAEAMGLCEEGQAAPLIAAGEFDIGGRCALSPSGGLLSMGHPMGPTGTGQIAEITRQLRGEAGTRQQPNAKIGLAHMVGVGAVCLVHVLQKV